MKKGTCVWLAALLLLTALPCAHASSGVYETWTYEEAGISVRIPPALAAENISSENGFALQITDPLDPNIVYYYTAIFNDAYEGLWMEDIAEDEYVGLLEYLIGPGEYAYDTHAEDGRTYLVASLAGGAQLHYILLLNGWFLTASAVVAQGYTVGDAAIDDLIALIGGLSLQG